MLRSLNRTPAPLRRAPRLIAVAAVLLLAGACGSKNDGAETGNAGAGKAAPATGRAATAVSGEPFAPVVASSELVVGQNRFALGILDRALNEPIPDAQVRLRFFTLQGANQGTLRTESDGRFVSPGRDAEPGDHMSHMGGSSASKEATVGVYVAQVQFDQPGRWAVEAVFKTPDGREGRVATPFEVLAEPVTPAIGTAAPRTRNLTARDVKELSEISSSSQPVPAFYQTTIADAIAAGRPALLGFVTPGWCETRFCGPSYELMKKLQPKYGEKAALIHMEIYKDGVNRVLFDSVKEWKIRSEPFFFVVDRNGIITAKFEGPVSLAELDAALAAVTS